MNKKTAVLTISFLILLSVFYVLYGINQPNSNSNGVKRVQIKEGTGTYEIGKLLQREGLLKSYTLFALYAKITKPILQAGSYELALNLSIPQIIDELKHGKDDVKVTFPEGLRSEEVAILASGIFPNIKYEDFMKIVVSENLEGKLFPDTYFFKRNISTNELIKKLNDTFKEKTKDIFTSNKTKLSENEVIILASILEREEPDINERPVVAGILVDRYLAGELLGADATTQYVFGTKADFWPKNLTSEQLGSANPFNTRKVVGLPPRAISNPGVNAISSVIGYKESAYNYYMHDKKGVVHYAKTLDEHNQNIWKFQN